MKTKYHLILLIVLMSCRSNKEEVFPTVQVLNELVYSSVIVQPDSLYQVYAAVGGILDKNIIKEGDIVKAGESIIQITNNTPVLNTQNASLALQLAKENFSGSAAVLSSIEDEISAATLKFDNDSITFFRQKKLWKNKIGTLAEYDAKKLNYRLSKNNLKLLRNKYGRSKNELKTVLKQAQNNYKSSLLVTKDFTVKSKIKGKVYALYKEPGEIVNTLQPLAAIGSENSFIIEMLVDEVDIVRIEKQQKVIISLEAYKGKVFEAQVSKIYPQKDIRNQTFKVEAVFIKSPKKLFPGLSGEANIIIATKADVLTIPKEYLINGDSVKTDDGIVKINTGLENLNYIEVTSGITKNTIIYKEEE